MEKLLLRSLRPFIEKQIKISALRLFEKHVYAKKWLLVNSDSTFINNLLWHAQVLVSCLHVSIHEPIKISHLVCAQKHCKTLLTAFFVASVVLPDLAQAQSGLCCTVFVS